MSIRWAGATIAALCVTFAGSRLLLGPPPPAAAAVTHGAGYRATVLGWTSWYGSYGLGELGMGWCIDHGIAAPDPELGYVPDPVADAGDAERAALAWMLGATGPAAAADPVASAAIMLAAHDIMGARYPYGELDVDQLSPGDLAGFGGDAAAVAGQARGLKAAALAHAHLRAPLALAVAAPAVDVGATSTYTVTITDAGGQPVPGIAVQVEVNGATVPNLVTDEQGQGTGSFTAVAGENHVVARAATPDPVLHAYAPTARPAQRVAIPARLELRGETTFTATAPGSLRIRKRGDPDGVASLAGARFGVFGIDATGELVPAGELTTGPDGTTPPLSLRTGRYQVEELAAPPGYEVAGPWTVDVPDGAEVVLDVVDRARPGRLRLYKVDPGGAPVAGAVFELARVDAGGEAATVVARPVSGTEPILVHDLTPGDYVLREVSAPPGWLVAPPQSVVIGPDTEVDVVVVDQPAPSPPTTVPPTTTPATTAPPTTTPPTTIAPTPAPEQPELPRTGRPLAGLVLVGAGFVLTGWALRSIGAARAPSDRFPASWAVTEPGPAGPPPPTDAG